MGLLDLINNFSDMIDEKMSNMSTDELCKKINNDSLMSETYVIELQARLRAEDIEELIDDYLEYVNYGYSSKVTDAYLVVIKNKLNHAEIRRRKKIRKKYEGQDYYLDELL